MSPQTVFMITLEGLAQDIRPMKYWNPQSSWTSTLAGILTRCKGFIILFIQGIDSFCVSQDHLAFFEQQQRQLDIWLVFAQTVSSGPFKDNGILPGFYDSGNDKAYRIFSLGILARHITKDIDIHEQKYVELLKLIKAQYAWKNINKLSYIFTPPKSFMITQEESAQKDIPKKYK